MFRRSSSRGGKKNYVEQEEEDLEQREGREEVKEEEEEAVTAGASTPPVKRSKKKAPAAEKSSKMRLVVEDSDSDICEIDPLTKEKVATLVTTPGTKVIMIKKPQSQSSRGKAPANQVAILPKGTELQAMLGGLMGMGVEYTLDEIYDGFVHGGKLGRAGMVLSQFQSLMGQRNLYYKDIRKVCFGMIVKPVFLNHPIPAFKKEPTIKAIRINPKRIEFVAEVDSKMHRLAVLGPKYSQALMPFLIDDDIDLECHIVINSRRAFVKVLLKCEKRKAIIAAMCCRPLGLVLLNADIPVSVPEFYPHSALFENFFTTLT